MRGRRGVSEIVASMVVLVIVSVLGAMLYNTSQSTFASQQSDLLSSVQTEIEKAQERFEIVSIENNGQSSVKANILNFSPPNTIDIVVSAVYVNSTQAYFTVTNPAIQKDEVKQFLVTLPSGMTFVSGKYYNLLVVSERGVGNVYSWKSS